MIASYSSTDRYLSRCERDQRRIAHFRKVREHFDPREMLIAYPEQHPVQHRSRRNEHVLQLGDALVEHLHDCSRTSSINSAMAA